MKISSVLAMAGLAALAMGCGGGGGNPGICYGGVQVCAGLDTGTTDAAPNTSTGYAAGKAACADFLLQQDAQAAYLNGETQLDGADNDGKACEHLPAQ